ncbi:MAG: hypothetical protein ACAH83_06010 [Alphaproteobacteria bacterium]
MSDTGKKQTAILLGSVAVNIFLVAFVFGRLSSPGTMPPPPPFGGDMQQRMMMAQQQKMGGGPPGGPGGQGMMAYGPGGGQSDGATFNMRVPPPPVFGPQDVFNPQEMQESMQEMQQNFQKAETLRADFAKRLSEGGVTKDDVLKHFADVDAIMGSVKNKVQEKTAEKIAAMPEQERKAFAERLTQHGGPPGMQPGPGQMMPPGQMPGQMPGGGMQGGMMPGGMNGGPPGGPPR